MKVVGRGWLMAGLGLVLMVGAVGCQGEDSANAALTAPQGAGAELFAGGGFHHGGMPLLRRLHRKLDLTDAQHDAVKAILQRERREMVTSGVLGKGPEAIHVAVQERRERVGDEIAGLLTPDQQKTFTEMRAKLRDRMAGGAGHGEMLARELGLTAAQQEQLTGMLEQKRAALKELRRDARAGQKSRADLRPLLRAEHEKFRAQLEAILTPEQKAHFQQMVDEWKKDMGR